MDVNNTHLRTLNPWSLNRKFYLNVFQNYGGFILLYDITSKQSFDHIIDNGYKRILDNRKRRTAEGPDGIPYPSGLQRFGCVLVGNKCDREDQRQVDRDLAQWWADSQGIKFFEIDSQKQFPINEIIVEVIRSTLRAQEYDDDELDEEMERRQKDDAVSDSKHKRTLSDSFQRVLKKLVP
jgi:GTPase SAR1 family protein